jgi:hypothetical protein
MPTANQLIEAALQKIGILGVGDTVDADDADVCLDRLNSLLESWENDGLYGYTTKDTSFTLPANTTSRTIGTSMQINMTRPVKILPGCFSRLDDIDYTLMPVTEAEYNAIALKSSYSTTAPAVCFYDGGLPTGNVYFWPPAATAVEVHLITPEPTTSASTLVTNLVFPPGYQRALEYNLAVEIAPDFNVEPSRFIVAAAANSKRMLRRTNSRVPQLDVDNIDRRRFTVEEITGGAHLT